jgi:hypothetical protein
MCFLLIGNKRSFLFAFLRAVSSLFVAARTQTIRDTVICFELKADVDCVCVRLEESSSLLIEGWFCAVKRRVELIPLLGIGRAECLGVGGWMPAALGDVGGGWKRFCGGEMVLPVQIV